MCGRDSQEAPTRTSAESFVGTDFTGCTGRVGTLVIAQHGFDLVGVVDVSAAIPVEV